MRSLASSEERHTRKMWESIIGTLAWVRVVIPQIGPMMQSSYSLLRGWKPKKEGERRRCSRKIINDWILRKGQREEKE